MIFICGVWTFLFTLLTILTKSQWCSYWYMQLRISSYSPLFSFPERYLCFVFVQLYSTGINILSLLFSYCSLFSKLHCPNNPNILDWFVHKLWFIKCLRERTGSVCCCFSTFLFFFLPEMPIFFFLRLFLFSQRNFLGSSARVAVLAPCSFIWVSLLYLWTLGYFHWKWFTNDILSSQFFSPCVLRWKVYCHVIWSSLYGIYAASVQWLWRIPTSVFQYRMVDFFCIYLLGLHGLSHSWICLSVFHHIWNHL